MFCGWLSASSTSPRMTRPEGNVILGSPLTFAIMLRGVARWCFGIAGWQDDLDRGAEMARASYPTMLSGMMWRKYVFAIPYGVLLPDATALARHR